MAVNISKCCQMAASNRGGPPPPPLPSNAFFSSVQGWTGFYSVANSGSVVRIVPTGALVYGISQTYNELSDAIRDSEGWNDGYPGLFAGNLPDPSLWEVRALLISGGAQYNQDAFNTWYNCNAVRQWGYIYPGGASPDVSGTIQLQIRRTDTQEILATSNNFNIIANYSIA